MDKQKKLMIITIIGLVLVILYLFSRPLSVLGGGPGPSGSSSSQGTCSDGGTYTCTETCTRTTPPASDCNRYYCCVGGGGYVSYSITSGCYVGACPSGMSISGTFSSQTSCQASCGTPTTPSGGDTCREDATSGGYLYSYFDSSVNSLTTCQAYAYTHYGCTAPTKLDVVGNCCMWSC